MPYIQQGAQWAVLKQHTRQIGLQVRSAGDLNFAITSILDEWLINHGISYSNLSMLIATLECAKLEMYRRIIAPYEDVKCEANGDAYTGGYWNVQS